MFPSCQFLNRITSNATPAPCCRISATKLRAICNRCVRFVHKCSQLTGHLWNFKQTGFFSFFSRSCTSVSKMHSTETDWPTSWWRTTCRQVYKIAHVFHHFFYSKYCTNDFLNTPVCPPMPLLLLSVKGTQLWPLQNVIDFDSQRTQCKSTLASTISQCLHRERLIKYSRQWFD